MASRPGREMRLNVATLFEETEMGVIYHRKIVKVADLYNYIPEYNEDGTEKHVILEGARFHVISWNSFGRVCSEPNCEINHFRKIDRSINQQVL